MKRLYFLMVMVLFSVNATAQTNLPSRIEIFDNSFGSYSGKFEYKYELNLTNDEYQLVRLKLYETNYKKEKKKTKPKVIETIPKQRIVQLIDELSKRKDSLTIDDLGYDYTWFDEHVDETYNLARNLWLKRWPSSPEWNTQQSAFIKEQLIKPANISDAVQRRFFSRGYITLNRSGGSSLKIKLFYADEVKTIEMGENFRGLPWKINGSALSYNQKISAVLNDILPKNKGYNKRKLAELEKEKVLAAIVDQLYQDKCEAKVAKLVFHNYENELGELKAHYAVSGYG